MSAFQGGHGFPRLHQLGRDEALAILARHHVARLAFTFNDRVDIQPVHYAYDHGFVYGRTSEGANLAGIAHLRWVALETDEVHGVLDWRSVVVHGAYERLELDGGTAEANRLAQHAVALLRAVIPAALRPSDASDHPTVLFRVSVDDISGRGAFPT